VLFSILSSSTAQAAQSTTITFQGRLLSSTGTTVPDGSYNMQFNLYTVASGGSTQWTDTRLVSATQGIVLKNGYFSVNLADTSVGGTAFPSTINWDQEQWLGLTVRGTTSCVFGSCSPTDGEMTPRFKLTSVPYAKSAAQLQQTNGASTLKVITTAPTANITYTFQDAAAGTYNVCTSANNCTGLGAYIQNGTALQSTANFNIRSAATTSITANFQAIALQTAEIIRVRDSADTTTVFSVTPAGNITVAGTYNGNTLTSTALTFSGAGATTVTSAAAQSLTVDSGTTGALNLGTGANAKTVTLGSATGASITNIQAGTGTAAGDLNIFTTAGGIINIGNNAVTNKVLNLGSTGSVNAASTVNIANTNANQTQAVTIGNTTSANNVVLIQGGTSATAIRLSAGAGGTIAIGSVNNNNITVNAAAVAGTTIVGGTTTTGTITLGRSTASNTISIGAAAGNLATQTISIGTSATAGSTTNTTIGSTVAGTTTLQGNVSISGGTNNGVYYRNASNNIATTAAGTTGQCLVATSAAAPSWGSCAGTGSGSTLQAAYDNGNTIATTTARNIAFTLADTATDSNLTVTTATGSTGFSSFVRADGAGTADPAQLLLVDNLDIDRAQPIGIKVQSAAGAITTALDVSDAEIVTALAVGTNDVTVNGATLTAAEFSLLDGRNGALVDTNDAVATAITGTGTLTAGALGAGFTTVAVGQGGTGATTLTAGGILFGNGTGAITASAVLTNGQLLIGDGTGAPTVAALTQGSDVTITNGAGSITIAVNENPTFTTSVTTPLLTNTAGLTVNATSANLLLQTTTSGNVVINGAGTLDVQDNATFAGTNTFSATSDALIVSSAPVASATASSIRLGATIAGGSANGTYLGSNPAAFTGDFVNLQVAGAVRLRVTNTGATTVGNTLTVTTGGATITAGDVAITAGNLTTGGTQRLSNTGALSNISTLSLSGAISGGTTVTASGLIQGGTGAFTATGSLTLGTASSATGQILFRQSASANTVTLQAPIAAIGANYTLSIPTIAANDTLCLSILSNCTAVGAASGALTGTYPGPTLAGVTGTGAVPFQSATTGVLASDSANFFFDNANDRLGVGTATVGTNRLTVNNAATTDNIINALDNGTSVFRVADGGNLLANNSATGTATYSNTAAQTNTTSITVNSAVGFAVNDIIFINNSGQDYYTRITNIATNTFTVTPAVSVDATSGVTPAVTKYQNVTNLGATSTDYTTQTNRFFQGYFLGGVVTGAGSTTLSDGILNSTTALALQTAGTTRLNVEATGNVGIGTGTTAAATRLEVSGTGTNVGITVDAPTGFYAMQYFAENGTNKWHYEVAPTSFGGYFSFVESGVAERMRIATGGNIGIGTSGTPSQLLSVGGTTGNLTVSATGAVVSASTIRSNTGFNFNGTAGATTTCTGGNVLSNQVVSGGITTGGTCSAAGSGTITGGGTATQLAYFSGASALTSSANLFWDNTNTRLGIGTNAPSRTLTVRATNTQPFTLITSDYVAGTTGSQFIVEFGAATGNTYTTLGALSAGGSAWNNIQIAPAGNVSIGSTTFNNKLSVNGIGVFGGVAAASSTEPIELQGSAAGISYYDRLNGTGAANRWVTYATGGVFSIWNNSVNRLSINTSGNATFSGTVAASNISSSIVGNYIVQRDANGYIFGNYVNTTDDMTGGIATGVVVKNGDNYHRTASIATLQSALGLQSLAYQSRSSSSGVSIANGGAGGAIGAEYLGTGGGAAAITFHRPGAFAAHFGIDTDSVFRVGGWSFGNASYRVLLGDAYNNNSTILTTGQINSGQLVNSDASVYGGGQVCRSGLAFGTYVYAHCASLRKYKDEIQDIPFGLDTIRQIRPVQYKWNVDTMDYDIGFIAEEIAAVNPIFGEYEGNASTPLTGVKYNHLTALLAKGVQELDVQVQSTSTRLALIEDGEFAGDIHVQGNAQIDGTLTVTGNTNVAQLTVNGKIITAGTAPTASVGAVSGASAAVSVSGNDTAGNISYSTGTVNLPLHPVSAGEQITATFASPYTAAPRIAVTAKNDKAAGVRYFVETSTTGFTLKFIDAPDPSAQYVFDYIIIQ